VPQGEPPPAIPGRALQKQNEVLPRANSQKLGEGGFVEGMIGNSQAHAEGHSDRPPDRQQ